MLVTFFYTHQFFVTTLLATESCDIFWLDQKKCHKSLGAFRIIFTGFGAIRAAFYWFMADLKENNSSRFAKFLPVGTRRWLTKFCSR
jgi:uncharacterized membrane protein